MNLAYLDAYTLNPGDLDWTPLQSLGSITFYDRTAPEQVVERARDAEILLVNKVKLPRPVLDQLVRRSLVRSRGDGYSLLPIVRHYAESKLDAAGPHLPELHERAVSHYRQAGTIERAL